MEINESTETTTQSSGGSSDTTAPATSGQGFYHTAGFGDTTESSQTANGPANTSQVHDNPFDPNPGVSGPGWSDQNSGHGSAATNPAGFPPPPAAQYGPRRLYRTEGPISGVATGLAEYFNLDVVLVRIILVAASILSFPVVPLAYIAAWMIIPKENPAPVAPIMTAPAPNYYPTPADTVSSPVDSYSGK